MWAASTLSNLSTERRRQVLPTRWGKLQKSAPLDSGFKFKSYLSSLNCWWARFPKEPSSPMKSSKNPWLPTSRLSTSSSKVKWRNSRVFWPPKLACLLPTRTWLLFKDLSTLLLSLAWKKSTSPTPASTSRTSCQSLVLSPSKRLSRSLPKLSETVSSRRKSATTTYGCRVWPLLTSMLQMSPSRSWTSVSSTACSSTRMRSKPWPTLRRMTGRTTETSVISTTIRTRKMVFKVSWRTMELTAMIFDWSFNF